jgi:hypothetical protein
MRFLTAYFCALLPLPLRSKFFSSALCPETPSIHTVSSDRKTKFHTHTNITGESEGFRAKATPNSPRLGYEHLHAQTNSRFGARMRYLQLEALRDEDFILEVSF